MYICLKWFYFQLKNHRQREEQLLDDYQNVRDKIDDIEHNCEPTGHQPEIKGKTILRLKNV